jgi:hypothetical protein
MGQPPAGQDGGMGASPVSSPAENGRGLRERLVQNRLCGDVQTPVGSCLGNCRCLVEGKPDYTFGLPDWREATLEDALAALEAAGVGRLRDSDEEAPAFIDPASTLAGIRKHHDVLADLIAGGAGKVLLATGHPVLLSHYGSIAGALADSGCRVLRPLDEDDDHPGAGDTLSASIAYVDGVAVLFQEGSARHTHLPDYMEAMLDRLGNDAPDLVVADHGFAGAAVAVGIPTLSIADANDPALPLAQARGRTDRVLLIDDGVKPDLFQIGRAHV